jgi:hypothetical protein
VKTRADKARCHLPILRANTSVVETKLRGGAWVEQPPAVDKYRGAHETLDFAQVEPSEIAVCRHEDERVGRGVRRRRSFASNLRQQDNQLVQGNAAATGDVECSGLVRFACADVCSTTCFTKVKSLLCVPSP